MLVSLGRCFTSKKQYEFSENYWKAKQHLLSLNLNLFELKRYKSILENTFNPRLDLIVPMISFLCGGVISVIVSEYLLIILKVNEELSNLQELWMTIFVLGSLAILCFCQVYRIKYISMKGKLTILLEEIIDEKESNNQIKAIGRKYKSRNY